MSRKYIIVIPDDEIVKYSGASHLFVPYEIAGVHGYVDTGLSMTSYEEPDLEAIRKEAYDKGKMDAYVEDSKNISELKKEVEEAYQKGSVDAWECAKKNAGEVYQQGLNDAWEAARQVSNMTLKTQKTIFDVEGTRYVVRKYTVQEAMERIKNYENEKPEEYKFTPGDEIVYKADHSIRVCVTSVNVGGWDGFALADVEDVCTFGGSYIDRPFEDWEKTGRKVNILKKVTEKEL